MRIRKKDLATITILFSIAFCIFFYFGFSFPSSDKSLSKFNIEESTLIDSPKMEEEKVLSFHLDLNEATWSEITLLPGIGEKLAEKIVEERNRLGGFASPEELTNVHGIGEKKLEKIRPFVIVSQPRKEDHPVQVQIPIEKDRNL